MRIYVSSSVSVKLDEYVEFLMKTCHYNIDEAEARRWEVEYQVNQHCNPILMKSGSSGTIKFKSVLQRQEIERFANNLLNFWESSKGEEVSGEIHNGMWVISYPTKEMYILPQLIVTMVSMKIHFLKQTYLSRNLNCVQ